MGRKIPAKKHRGVKDPAVQQARRLQSLQGKVDLPPTAEDDQPIPRSLLRLFAPRPRSRPDVPRHSGVKSQAGAKSRGTAVSRLRAAPGEGAREFGRRISCAVRALHGDLQYPMDEEEYSEESHSERRARRRNNKQTTAAPAAPTRSQKLAAKRLAKKQDKQEIGLLEPQYERVQFGDVAHAPPVLTAPRRAAAAAGKPRPGRSGLLLHAMLQGSGGAGAEPDAADRRRRERARQDAVEAYRALKAARRKQS